MYICTYTCPCVFLFFVCERVCVFILFVQPHQKAGAKATLTKLRVKFNSNLMARTPISTSQRFFRGSRYR